MHDAATSSAVWRDLLERIDVGILVIDGDGVVRYANRAAVAMYPDKSGSLLGAHIGVPAITEASEMEVPLGDHVLHVELRAGQIDWDGQRATLAELRDITQRHAVREALRRTEESYRPLFEQNPNAMWVCEAGGGRLLAVNAAASALLGYSMKELLTKDVPSLLPPEDVAGFRKYVASRGPANREQVGLHRFQRCDGSVIDVDIVLHTLTFEGRAAELVLAKDITEQRRAERERASAEAKFRAISEQSLAGIMIMNTEGRFLYVNPRAAALGGYTPDELVGRPAMELVKEADRPLVMERMRNVFAGGPTGTPFSYSVVTKDGTERTVGASGTLAWLEGQPVAIAIMQDVTDKVRAEAQVRDYVSRLERAVSGTVRVIGGMMSVRDPYTAGHDVRVGQLAAAIAAEMGLDAAMQASLELCGEVHDVGKITIPAETLAKPAGLSPTERKLVEMHAEAGYGILKDIDAPWPLARVAYEHHERIDGSGYPRGLRGDAICIEARILAVADVMESMMSHRPYRPALGLDAALTEIEAGAGKRYDAAASKACLALFREKRFSFTAART